MTNDEIAALRKSLCHFIALATIETSTAERQIFARLAFGLLADELVSESEEMERLLGGISDELEATFAAIPRASGGSIWQS